MRTKKDKLADELAQQVECCKGLFNELQQCRQQVRQLREACEAALLLADADGNLPDNGEYQGGAIADQIRCALEDTATGGITRHSKDS